MALFDDIFGRTQYPYSPVFGASQPPFSPTANATTRTNPGLGSRILGLLRNPSVNQYLQQLGPQLLAQSGRAPMGTTVGQRIGTAATNANKAYQDAMNNRIWRAQREKEIEKYEKEVKEEKRLRKMDEEMAEDLANLESPPSPQRLLEYGVLRKNPAITKLGLSKMYPPEIKRYPGSMTTPWMVTEDNKVVGTGMIRPLVDPITRQIIDPSTGKIMSFGQPTQQTKPPEVTTPTKEEKDFFEYYIHPIGKGLGKAGSAVKDYFLGSDTAEKMKETTGVDVTGKKSPQIPLGTRGGLGLGGRSTSGGGGLGAPAEFWKRVETAKDWLNEGLPPEIASETDPVMLMKYRRDFGHLLSPSALEALDRKIARGGRAFQR